MPEPLRAPGPSYVREQRIELPDGRSASVGMRPPSMGPDDWWLGVLWVADDDGVVPFEALASTAGPPPDPPLARLGPILAGALGGLVREEAGRLAIRVAAMATDGADERPWRSPAVVRLAIGLEPVRAATLRPNALTQEILTAFRRSVEGLARR